ncbi:MAG: hypothetical protein MZU95_10740 [Desulfomicrobium escambiense]|nr:hypothetical protein [Desulfomicrobium escambiense]
MARRSAGRRRWSLCAARIQALRAEPLVDPAPGQQRQHGADAPGPPALLRRCSGQAGPSGGLCASAGIAACEADFGRVEHNAPARPSQRRDDRQLGPGHRPHLDPPGRARASRPGSKGTRVLTISPGGDGHEAWSDEFIRVRPGADRFLAAAVCRTAASIAGASCPDRGWRPPTGRRSARLRHGPAGSGAGRGRAGSGMAAVERLADLYGVRRAGGHARSAGGCSATSTAAENVRFINALALLSGNVGRSGGGVYFHLPLLPQPRPRLDQGARATAGRRAFHIAAIGRGHPGRPDPPVRMLWVNGTNAGQPGARTRSETAARLRARGVQGGGGRLHDRHGRAGRPGAALRAHARAGGRRRLLSARVRPIRRGRWLAPPPEARDRPVDRDGGRPAPEPAGGHARRRKTACGRLDLAPISRPTLEALQDRAASCSSRRPPDRLRGPAVRPRRRAATASRGSCTPSRRRPAGYPLRLLSLVRPDGHPLPDPARGPAAVAAQGLGGAGLPGPGSRSTLGTAGGPGLAARGGWRVTVAGRCPGCTPAVVVYRRGDWRKLGGGINRIIADTETDMGHGRRPTTRSTCALEN